MNIIDFIPKGIENKISTAELMDKTNLSQRKVCKEIEKARETGSVILSSSKGGYWLPDISDAAIVEQIKRFIAFMESKNTFKTTKSAKELLKVINTGSQSKLEI